MCLPLIHPLADTIGEKRYDTCNGVSCRSQPSLQIPLRITYTIRVQTPELDNNTRLLYY